MTIKTSFQKVVILRQKTSEPKMVKPLSSHSTAALVGLQRQAVEIRDNGSSGPSSHPKEKPPLLSHCSKGFDLAWN